MLEGVTVSEPLLGLTATGLPGRPGADMVADVPPVADHEIVELEPAHIDAGEAERLFMTGN